MKPFLVAEGRVELPALGLWILRSNHLSYPAIYFFIRTIFESWSPESYALTNPDDYRDYPAIFQLECKSKKIFKNWQIFVK